MESLVQFLMLLICLVAVIKLSLAPRWLSLVFACLLSGFTIYIKDYCSEQTIAGISLYIEQKELRESMAILLTLESLLYMFTAFNPRKKALRLYPSLLIFAIIFYTETNLFFSFAGIDFTMLALVLGAVVLVLFTALPYLIKKLLPEEELRLELLFLTSTLMTALGLLTTTNDSISYQAPTTELSLRGLAIALALFSLCFALGYYLPRIKDLLFKKK